MTRFKELRRIEAAIKHRDADSLKWAAEYCRGRIASARTKRGEDQWRRVEKRVLAAIKVADRIREIAGR